MRWGAPAVLSCGLLTASTLRAESPSLNLRGLEPPMDPQGSLALEPTTTPGHGNFGASLWTSYAYRLVQVQDKDGKELAVPVRHQVSSDALFNWGLGQRWALGLALPVVAFQQGDRIANDDWRPSKTALGDPTFELKMNVLPKGPLGGVGLAGFTRLTLPLGSEESGLGSDVVTGQLGVRGELDLILASVRASAGYTVRQNTQIWWGDQFGNHAPWAVGVVLKPQAFGWDKQGRWQWFLESHGALAITPEFGTKHSSPALLSVATRYALGGDFSALSGLEIPLNGGIGAPSLRAVIGLSWAPRFLDADGDGIADDADDCPEGMPEDRDGFEDDDGCPDDDNDGDAVPDAQDRCPLVAEDIDNHQDEDGCPDLDNDSDKILDVDDACPNELGVPSRNKKYNGCPRKDSDGDGIADDADRCPERPEDFDGRHDQDGCPDPDDDADGILDNEDDCPTQRGPRRTIAGLNGCPDPDVDGDTYYGNVGDRFASESLFGPESRPVGTARDLCPDVAEDFDGDLDDDGCNDPPAPKKKAVALVTLEMSGSEGLVKFSRSPKWSTVNADALAASDIVLLRALAKELRSHRDWTALVTVLPQIATQESTELSKRRAELVVRQLKQLTLRENSAAVAVDTVRLAPEKGKQRATAGLFVSLHTQVRRATTADPGPAAPVGGSPPTPNPGGSTPPATPGDTQPKP